MWFIYNWEMEEAFISLAMSSFPVLIDALSDAPTS